VSAGEVARLRAALDETHASFGRAITAMADAVAALANLTMALAPLELAARRSVVDDVGEEDKNHE